MKHRSIFVEVVTRLGTWHHTWVQSADAASRTCVIAGGGPSGRALAWACANRGTAVHLITADQDVPSHNLCAFADELPALFVDETYTDVVAVADGCQFLLPDYVRLDAAALYRETNNHPLITITIGRVVAVHDHHVVLDDGRHLRASVAVDARGSHGTGGWVQTAYGVRLQVPSAQWSSGRVVFMDWTPSPAARQDEPPTFLYALHHADGTVLLEETCLASRTPMALANLRTRLDARLQARGLRIADAITTEQVHIPMGTSVGAADHLCFGAAAGFVHPATGYSVGTSFAAAQRFADALAGGGTTDQLRMAIWPAPHRRAHQIVSEAMKAVLHTDADAALMATFFSSFFRSANHMSFLRPTQPLAVLTLMMSMFIRAPLSLQRHLMRVTSLRSVLFSPSAKLEGVGRA
jgi:lycopene beta-cyclase